MSAKRTLARRILPAACAITAMGFVAAALAQAPPMAKDASWSLRLPKEEKVMYRGAVSFDGAGAGSMGGMLYPAPNLVGLFAAVITHGVIADSLQERQKREIQEKADQVLTPYAPFLKDYQHRQLMHKGLGKLPAGGSKRLLETADKPADNDWLVESTPLFFMTQDQRAIVLDNAILIYPPGRAEAAYQNLIRVVSRPHEGDNVHGFWTANEGEGLKEESATLFALSLEIALSEASGGGRESRPQRTYRYMEGGSERMERAELISDQCSRLVVRTLRGWLMSIPARKSASECGDAPAAAKP